MIQLRLRVAALLPGALLFSGLLHGAAAAQTATDPLTALKVAMESAETSLRQGELQLAESQCRGVLVQGWMLIGSVAGAEGRLDEARAAFERASTSTTRPRDALLQLSSVYVQQRNPAPAINILTKIVARSRKDVEARRLLVQALAAAGQNREAVQELEEAVGEVPDDLELKYALACGNLQIKKVDDADRLFAEIAKVRPLAETHVLIGRAYRDAGEYGRARTALQTALKMDPRVRRAHYYLGTVALLDGGIVRLDEAIADFEQEMKIAPDDPVTTLRLGMAYVLAKRPADALPLLERSAGSPRPTADAFHYLGRCQLALDRPADAIVSLKRALELTHPDPSNPDQVGVVRNIEYQLGLALRRAGSPEEAAVHFAAAEQASGLATDVRREDLTRYLSDAPAATSVSGIPPRETVFPLVDASPEARAEIGRAATSAIASAYLNLGVMHAQAQRFGRAAEFFEQAAAADPDFPQVQYSLGVAYFNAGQFAKATAPLSRVVAADPGNLQVRRMLAAAHLNAEEYDKAARLLVDDPGRQSDPQLQFAYGLALIRSDHPREANAVFSALIAEHGESPEVNLLLGQANAADGDYDAAIQSLQRAVKAKPDIAGANASLGYIYMKQGKLDEAEAVLRAELRVNPSDVLASHTLATVLEMLERKDEAIAIERAVLKAKPTYADARYLLGKLLLAQGAALEAAENLEAAARLAPDDPNIHYQLGQAYTKLGRTEAAQEQFDVFRKLKDIRGGRTK
jgi:tetratricopeptide (TPR) repeat protein